MTKSAGIIGLGSIGLPIAVNMMAKGLSVHGYRRSAMTEFEATGGKPAASPKKMAETFVVIVRLVEDISEVE